MSGPRLSLPADERVGVAVRKRHGGRPRKFFP
jgi:hypothetical protein